MKTKFESLNNLALKYAMIVHRLVENPKLLIAYKENIWLLNEDLENEEDIINICDKLNIIKNIQTIDDLIEYLNETDKKDILFGTLLHNNLYLSGLDMVHQPQSILLNKVVKQLNINKVIYEDIDGESYYQISRYELPHKKDYRKIPSAFHGTSSKYAQKIIKEGLRPNLGLNNFKTTGIPTHEDVVFLTTNFSKAEYHARIATRATKSPFEVIFEFKIPDQEKIKPDYDISKLKQDDFIEDDQKSSKDLGVFAYEGRIPPNFITNYWIKSENIGLDNFIELTKEQFIKALNNDGYFEDYLDEEE